MAYVSSEELGKKFDVIVYGTGLTESILSAALSRNGVSVLHIDANHFYGGEWGSLMYREFIDFCDLATSPPSDPQMDKSEPSETDSNSKRYYLHTRVSSLYENMVQEFVEAPDTPVPDAMGSVENVPSTEIPPLDSTATLGVTPEDTTSVDNTDPSDETVTTKTIPQDLSEEVPQSLLESESPQATKKDIESENVPSISDASLAPSETPESPTHPEQDQVTPAAPNPVPIVKPVPEGPLLSWTELKSQYRMFTFDLWPKLIYATDPFVDMIVRSTVTKYLEFKAVNKIVTVLGGELTSVPASRADVFTSKTVSVLEKRLLMRFVSFVMDMEKNSEEVDKFRGLPFSQLLEHMNLNAKLCALIQSSIAQVDSDALTETGLERSRFYLQSIGKYSNSPFLWPVYGIGELPQAFCRMSAVFGGVYMLRKEIQYLEVVESGGVSRCCSVRDNESTTFSCKHVILGASFVPSIAPTARYSRAILATNRKLSPAHCSDVRSDVGFITVPSHTLGPEQPHTVKVIELSPYSQSVPERCYLVHLTSLARLTAREDLLPVVNFLFHNTSDQSDLPPKPKVLYAIYYNYNSRQVPPENRSHIAENVHLISSPDTQPSYQELLSEAKEVFERICPGDDFLPPPPDLEDIIYESPSPDPTQEKEGNEGEDPASPINGGNTELLNADSDEK